MKNKILFALIFVLVIIPISAETFPQKAQIDFTKTCTNSSNDICQSTSACNITIRYPNSTAFASDQKMTNNANGIFNYTISEGQHDKLGRYFWDMFCCDGSDCGEAHGDYYITKTGVELTQEKAIVYVGMLGIIIFMFVVTIGGIALLPGSNTRDDDTKLLTINKLKYLRAVLYVVGWALLMAIMFTSANISFLYLETQLMGNFFFLFYRMMMVLSLPAMIIWFIFIFISIFNDSETKKMIERGVQM